MIANRFLPSIVRPTRIKHQSATLIDHTWIRFDSKLVFSAIINTEIAGPFGYTDHLPTITILQTNLEKKVQPKTIKKYFFTHQGQENRRLGLRQENFADILNTNDPDQIFTKTQEMYGKHYFSNQTIKEVKLQSNQTPRQPWMTQAILSKIRTRDRLSSIKARREDYKRIRNEITACCRKAERDYTVKKIQESIGDIKKHWKILNKLINKANNKDEIAERFLF